MGTAKDGNTPGEDAKGESARQGKAAHPFIRDLEPFFYTRPITYVDVGAHEGSVFERMTASSINVREAHLIEPNRRSFDVLRESAEEHVKTGNVACHNVAISSAPGSLTMRDEGTMTHVAQAPGGQPPDEGVESPFFEVKTVTLDELARSCDIKHIEILKIDVEGHEMAVLEGAKELLTAESVDVIYVEAGLNPEAEQHTYYRSIEDTLNSYGYKIFKIYEQKNEWIDDSPALRRVNIAFMSAAFAANNPYRLSRELFRLREQHKALAEEADELRAQLEKRESALALRERERRAAASRLADIEQRLAEQSVLLRRHNAEVAQIRSERDAYVEYADKLEMKYQSVLKSRTWRAMAPVRIAGRVMRRGLGKSASGRSRLPKRPRLDGTALSRAGSSQVAGNAEYITTLVKELDFENIFALKEKFERALATEEGFLSHSYLLGALARKTSAFGFGAQAADAVFRRYHGRRDELVAAYGERDYRRFIADTAVNFTRVGRYDDARAMLDEEIAAGMGGLLATRAEICWIHDPEAAAADVATVLTQQGTKGESTGNALLYKHLRLNVLRESGLAELPSADDGEFLLVDAAQALETGQFDEYRRQVNRFFEDQELSAPISSSSTAFAFEELAPASTPSTDDGPLVSVIMTTFNAASTVEYAARSILGQTHRRLELIIVDDQSTDATMDLLTEIARSDGRVKVVRSDVNAGTYVARNSALDMAAGEYITFHDSDDWAHPQRIETHVSVMQSDPVLYATRSSWLRADAGGRLDFRRWRKRLAHPNPASVFMKRDVLEMIGHFDRVRFSADSEYWYRLQRVFGRKAVRSIPQCLGFGRQHDSSLTTSGPGARDAEDYSAIRSAYQYSWLEWHSTNRISDLYLEPAGGQRRFWAPPEMLAAGDEGNDRLASLARCYPQLSGTKSTPNLLFAISLASQKAAANWDLTSDLLRRTLLSVINQTDGRWRVIVCGHEKPELKEFDDPRIMFVEADIDPPAHSGQFRKDKMWKRRLLGSFLRDLGGGYFFPLDADDLIHKDLVASVLESDNRRGYRIERGYAHDFANQRLAPVPGVWSVPFDRVCGSSAVLHFEAEDLPRDGRSDPDLYFNLFQSHAYWPIVAEESGRPFETLPFPAAVYVVNHSQNLSFGLQRAGERTRNIIASIEREALPDGEKVLRDDFGQD
ncbi:FkbM family methyltransferase [Phytoactinopolyspora alkaliphila]|uniref:FkbM family methyltransferase n=1 Tax=Phytoactinopolyspora alkaliphila TaxID=1783498 RepID=A0A6N9YGF8_9ACTN|nr:FkbM family methyltransferase [Phytoactinopolyspora alkaliphila]NED94083.1 FkbM family methyltransferase [Phytoactinopolyspora alkaliphila]